MPVFFFADANGGYSQAKKAGIVSNQLRFDGREVEKIGMDDLPQFWMRHSSRLSVYDQNLFYLRVVQALQQNAFPDHARRPGYDCFDFHGMKLEKTWKFASKAIKPEFMESNKEALLNAIERVKYRRSTGEATVTGEEIARKLDLSEKQLDAFINGEKEPPADLASRLMSAYNLKTFMVRHTSVGRAQRPEPPQNESEIRKSNSRSLKAIIGLIKDRGKRKGITITEEEMAEKIGVPAAKIPAWLEDKEKTPDDLTQRLLSAYQDLLDAAQADDNKEALARAVLWIRNRGLEEGMNITVAEMAGKAGVSGEQLYAFLNGEEDTPADLGFKLETAYKFLLEDIDKVEMIENINIIRQRPDSGTRP